jgi:hypothetical protein
MRTSRPLFPAEQGTFLARHYAPHLAAMYRAQELILPSERSKAPRRRLERAWHKNLLTANQSNSTSKAYSSQASCREVRIFLRVFRLLEFVDGAEVQGFAAELGLCRADLPHRFNPFKNPDDVGGPGFREGSGRDPQGGKAQGGDRAFHVHSPFRRHLRKTFPSFKRHKPKSRTVPSGQARSTPEWSRTVRRGKKIPLYRKIFLFFENYFYSFNVISLYRSKIIEKHVKKRRRFG